MKEHIKLQTHKIRITKKSNKKQQKFRSLLQKKKKKSTIANKMEVRDETIKKFEG